MSADGRPLVMRRIKSMCGGPPILTEQLQVDHLTPVALPPSEAEPVFILGSVRSGTSAMVNALKDGAQIRGYYETNVGPLMQRLIDTTEEFFANFSPDYLAAKDYHLIGSVDPKAIGTVIKNYFATVFKVKLGEGRWVGKSPDSYLRAPMVRASRHLASMFPKARFIYCMRRGIENVLSRQKKFPGVPFAYHCQSWADSIEEWFKLKPELGERALEVRQRDIALRPKEVADQLARFLGLTPVERDGVLRVFEGPRAEQIHVGLEHHELAFEETPWDESHRAVFLRWCGPAMQAAGYALEGGPRASGPREAGAPLSIVFPVVREAVRTKNVHPQWGFSEIDRATLQIHPNPPGGGAAEVRWPAIRFVGESCCLAELSLAHAQSQPVVFGLRIERSVDGKVCVETAVELEQALEWRRCELKFSPLNGAHDVILWVRMADSATSSDYAWAQFRDVRLV
jgi:hypothetical protein